jgi:argininosuccinate lyase
MKLWEKSFEIDKVIERFTIGQDKIFDLELVPYDIAGNLAHVRMLWKVGFLSEAEYTSLEDELEFLSNKVAEGEFIIEDGVEDVHSQVELELTKALGETGKKIHAGRSRNDQVLTDLKLYFRTWLEQRQIQLNDLFDQFLIAAKKHADVPMAGFTHTQVAMRSSFGMWFGAYAEQLVDELTVVKNTYQVINQNPLGTAAGYGSSFPIDRKLTTKYLQFSDMHINPIHAHFQRGKSEWRMANVISSLSQVINRFASDVCLFNNQNFRLVELPDKMTTGSSIMPHKKNPDVFELLRGKSAVLTSLPSQILALTNNLISGYHRDYQLLKENLFPAMRTIEDCIDILKRSISRGKQRY